MPKMADKVKQQCTHLSLKRKTELLKKLEVGEGGKKKRDVAEEVGVPADTISDLLKPKEKMRATQVSTSKQ